jgi:hypothetical protein
LEDHGADLVELDEILGYHLEQASRYRAELGQPDKDVAERAGRHLAAAGRRAHLRGDTGAGFVLLGRALALLRPTRLDVMLELDFAVVQPTTQQAAAVAEAAAERARLEGDAAGAEVEELERLARAALPVLEEIRNHRGLAHVWHAIALGAANMRGQFEDCARAAEQALEHWRLAGVPQTNPGALDMALTVGPRPAEEALETFDKAMPETPHPYWLGFRAWPLGMQGRLGEAETLATAASERAFEVRGSHGIADWTSAEVAALAGDHERFPPPRTPVRMAGSRESPSRALDIRAAARSRTVRARSRGRRRRVSAEGP